MKAEAGITGPDVRSDCLFRIETKSRGGIHKEIRSKVEAMYGGDIRSLVDEGLRFFGIRHAIVTLEDQGALPFVVMARMEAAMKKVIRTDKEWLPAMQKECTYFSTKDRIRFSRLYLPGNTPKMMINAGIHRPHGIILDLEDSVAPEKKQEARILVRNALRSIDFFGAERMVRINQLPMGLDDLDAIIPHNVHLVLIPKCEGPEQVRSVESEVNRIRKSRKIKPAVCYMPIIESALGVENAFAIATASPDVVALAIGLEDYSADMGVMRTREATESLYARTRLVNACKAAGIQAIDSVYSDVADEEGLQQTIHVSKSLGFEGMGCIHPNQISIIHQGYAPVPEEIEKAKKIVKAFWEAREKGLGVVALGTKMIDAPVVKRAEKVIGLAVKFGLISKNWRTDDGKK